MAVVAVAVDGCGGAGKSTLAARIAAEINDTTVIHTDDFASWDNPVDWWPRLLEQVLQPLAEGRPARYQRYDWEAAELAEWHDVPSTGYLLIEGVTSSRREFRPYLAATIWVEATREIRLQRGLERDGVEARELWLGWQAAEDAYVQRDQPAAAANLIITGEGGAPWTGPERPDECI